jgi:hypothetical protein
MTTSKLSENVAKLKYSERSHSQNAGNEIKSEECFSTFLFRIFVLPSAIEKDKC